jgi:hypothetical protein
MATPAQKAHLRKMREAKEAKRLEAARSAVEADNPIDEGQSIDDLDTTPLRAPRRAAAPKRAAPRKAPAPPPRARPRIPQPRADYEMPPKRQTRTRLDPEVEMRARRVGVGNMRPPPRPDPTVRRDFMRDPQTGRIIIERDGVMYTRRVVNTGDKFQVDANDIPDGMSYQWIAVTVDGMEQRNSMAQFEMNGWRPVPMSRYPGRYGPQKAKNGAINHEPIIIEGLMLVERPIELTIEAREEEIGAAKSLVKTRNEQFQPRLPDALARRGTGLRAKRTIEGMPPDVGRPVYEMDVDDGLLR